MSKGIIILDEIPKTCIECPMHYHATDMSIGNFKFEQLFKCELEPEGVEQAYLEDICNKKPNWCPIRPLPDHENHCNNGRYDKGWNDCLRVIGGVRHE